MANPIDYAMMVLKQWEDVDWEQPEAVGQYSDNPQIEQMLQPWPEGTNIGWQRGPPEDGKQGPVLSAEEAMQRDKQRQQMAQRGMGSFLQSSAPFRFGTRGEQLEQPWRGPPNVGGTPSTGALAQVQPPINQQYQPPAPTE